MNGMQISGIFLGIVMLCGSIPLGYSEPLKVQLEQGIETNQIQCDNPNHVLVLRTNGKLACVSIKNAEKLNWEIVENKINVIPSDIQDSSNDVKVEQSETLELSNENVSVVPTETESADNMEMIPTEEQTPDKVSSLYDNSSSVLIKSDEPYDPKDFPLNQYSSELATQRAPSPMTMDDPFNLDKIVRFDSDGNIFQYEAALDNNFPISQASPGVNGIVTQPRTFIIDEWMPTVIPDGQELKVVVWSGQLEIRGQVLERLSFIYAPVDVLLTAQNNTGSVYNVNGFVVGGQYFVSPPKTQEDILWYENRIIEFGNWERDIILGERVLVTEGDDLISIIEINTEDIRFGSSSYRYNVAELTEILESIPALQP